jgi:hypothetical protein
MNILLGGRVSCSLNFFMDTLLHPFKIIYFAIVIFLFFNP